ncbi:DegT/DnrJ/EryC1/StrS family aminotransferase [Terrisporobacter sp.]
MYKSIVIMKSSMPPMEEYIEKMKELWDSKYLTNSGRFHREFEEALKKFLNVSNVSLFSNGHLGLQLTLEAMNLSGEVITTPFTFASTTQAIVRNNLTPVFCDIKEDDYTIDENKIEELVTDKTCAIVPVHVYGNVCNVYEIERIAKKHNLKVIYDAAHAFNIKVNGRSISDFGDASMISLHATKVFHAIEGGLVVFHDDDLVDKLNKIKNFGFLTEDVVDEIGTHARMNEFQAIMGLCNLNHIEGEILKRKKLTKRYRENLRKVRGIKIMEEVEGIENNYTYFPIVVDREKFGFDRDYLYDVLRKNNIFPRKYFFRLTNDFECYKGKFAESKTPIAIKIANSVLTLPLFADLTMEEVDKVCKVIENLQGV